MWGGVECTVNRVGNTWFNQLERTGHAHREGDLNRIAALGIRTLRYPILWELHEKAPGAAIDWRATDRRLQRARQLGIVPIAGLIHHGSGPAHTDLLHADFAPGLASFAGQVARRYPWLEWYTPVNEPLTTARFSALYGLWYPHAHSDAAFTRALINQCRAVVLCMQEVRKVNPQAKLLQTEDLGKAYSTPHMKYQARFENQRRWSTWDLLTGRVDSHHPLRAYLLRTGISAAELDWFQANQCVPECIGINHYVTSDRYLDEQASKYPPAFRGRNAREEYADVEAVRVLKRARATWERTIREAALRYRLPIVLSEVHLGCTREEQLRWLSEAWSAASAAHARGYPVRAVTAWALFGSVGWNTLLTVDTDHYESGAFDVGAGMPRETAVGKLIRDLAGMQTEPLRGMSKIGWWRRPQRLLYGVAKGATGRDRGRGDTAAVLLITGGSGGVAQALSAACERRGIRHRCLARLELDITDQAAVKSVVQELEPWALINAAGWGDVARSEREPERCRRDNMAGAGVLAAALHAAQVRYLTFSSAHVFDGRKNHPYRESSPIAPLNCFGRSKADAEQAVLQLHPTALIVRLGRCFGALTAPGSDSGNWLESILQNLRERKPYRAVADILESPTYLPHMADACLDLLMDAESGLWHLANRGSASEADLIAECAMRLGIDSASLQPVAAASLPTNAQLGRYLVLDTERGAPLPPWREAAGQFVAAICSRSSAAMRQSRRIA